MQVGTIGHYRAGGEESLAVVTGVTRDEGRPETVDLIVFPRGGVTYNLDSIPAAPTFGPTPSISFHAVLDCPVQL